MKDKQQKPNAVIIKVTKTGDCEIHRKSHKIKTKLTKPKDMGGES
jgi:hypothetical protein